MTTSPPKTLAICADDFGLAPGISAGIAALARAGRLNAISCITNAPHWNASAALLQGLPQSVDVGLHINLTEGVPLSRALAARWARLPSLPELMLRAHLGALPRSALQDEIQAQRDAFEHSSGSAPAYLDGHQHVHQFPLLRDLVLSLAERTQPVPALRSTGTLPGPGAAFKRWLIVNSGGRALARELAQRGWRHNAALLGAYDFRAHDYRALMQRWLARAPRRAGMLFCHPGAHAPGDPPDAIASARERELAYLGSDDFVRDLASAQVTLGRAWSG